MESEQVQKKQSGVNIFGLHVPNWLIVLIVIVIIIAIAYHYGYLDNITSMGNETIALNPSVVQPNDLALSPVESYLPPTTA